MDTVIPMPDSACARSIATRLVDDGYVFIEGAYYTAPGRGDEVVSFQESYFRLPLDPAPGNRRRAYARYAFSGGCLRASDVREYFQSPEYNYADGGRVRKFAEIEEGVRTGGVMGGVVMRDLEVVRDSGLVSFDKPIRIGVHQIRYQPAGGVPAFSSPPWLHRDDETIVFVHLVNLSSNTIGGDNVIASSERVFETVLRLNTPLDTLCVTRKKLHAVTPIAAPNGGVGYRDVLLVTFETEIELSESASKHY